MSFYYDSFVKNLKKNSVKPTDTIHSVMLKLEGSASNIPQFPKLKTFIRKYWAFEKTILNSSYYNFESQNYIDPVIDVGNSGQKFVVFEDTVFSLCPTCGGRIFPEFNHCPFCSCSSKGISPTTSTFQEISSNTLRKSKTANKKKFLTASFEGKGMFFDDGEITVTYKELNDTLKTIDKYIP